MIKRERRQVLTDEEKCEVAQRCNENHHRVTGRDLRAEGCRGSGIDLEEEDLGAQLAKAQEITKLAQLVYGREFDRFMNQKIPYLGYRTPVESIAEGRIEEVRDFLLMVYDGMNEGTDL